MSATIIWLPDMQFNQRRLKAWTFQSIIRQYISSPPLKRTILIKHTCTHGIVNTFRIDRTNCCFSVCNPVDRDSWWRIRRCFLMLKHKGKLTVSERCRKDRAVLKMPLPDIEERMICSFLTSASPYFKPTTCSPQHFIFVPPWGTPINPREVIKTINCAREALGLQLMEQDAAIAPVTFGLVTGPYYGEPIFIPPAHRTTEQQFKEHEWKLWNGHAATPPPYCVLSDYAAYLKLSYGGKSYDKWPADFLADGEVRKTRSNKGAPAVH